MKKMSLLLVLLLLVCMVYSVNAQISLGVTGGLNLANADIDPDQDADWKNIYAVGGGVVFDYAINDNVAIHILPMYLKKGTKAKEDNFEVKFNVTYLEFPVLLKYNLKMEKAKPYLLAGPTFGYLLKADRKTVVRGIIVEEDDDMKKSMTTMNLGMMVGGGLNAPMGNNSFFIEVRYSYGFTNINDDPEDTDTKVKTRGIQFFAGFTFPIDL